MTTHIINGIKIHTNFDPPPIPIRTKDWVAVTDDYDMTDVDEYGAAYSSHPIGHGATEQGAIDDLLDQLEDATDDGFEPFPSQAWHGG